MLGWIGSLGRLIGTGSYTQDVMNVMEAYWSDGQAHSEAVIEAAVGIWGRSLSTAEVRASTMFLEGSISPRVLGMIGRDMLLFGESLWMIEDGGRTLIPVYTYHVDGSPDPDTWVYRMLVPGPTVTRNEVRRPAAGVLHFRHNELAEQAWTGRSPLAIGERLVANALATYLLREGQQYTGQHLVRPESDELSASLEHRRNLLEESERQEGFRKLGVQRRRFGNLTRGGPENYKRIRFGPEFEQYGVELRRDLEVSILAAAGIPPGLVLGSGGGTATREDLRRLYALTIQPMARLIEREFQDKFPRGGVMIDAGGQAREADAASKGRALASKAQAAQVLVGLGVDPAQALELADIAPSGSITIGQPMPMMNDEEDA